ncbi:MAG: NADH-quinone oxidoreductase subunit J [Gammaproteobacteria bacterium]|nr:NADH-quinone oxidoreductase subunit J [Gammaproteobacteria bacterium]
MDIPIPQAVFYLFSFIMVAAAIMVITVRNPVYAALFLVLTFFSAAAIWLLLEAEFLAIVLVVVYVGAVMVLFLFVVMMLDINLAPLKEGFVSYLPVGIAVALLMAAEMLVVVWTRDRFGPEIYPVPAAAEAGTSNTAALGELLYTNFLLPFEIAGVILLVAIVSAVTLTLRKRSGVRSQSPSHQVRVKRDERVRLVDIASESPDGRSD